MRAKASSTHRQSFRLGRGGVGAGGVEQHGGHGQQHVTPAVATHPGPPPNVFAVVAAATRRHQAWQPELVHRSVDAAEESIDASNQAAAAAQQRARHLDLPPKGVAGTGGVSQSRRHPASKPGGGATRPLKHDAWRDGLLQPGPR